MLNRTNRTLSANRNRLNLGTRKLDRKASANIGSLTLRTAHVDLAVSVRAGFVEYPGFGFEGPPIGVLKPVMPAMLAMSGSSPESSRSTPGRASRDQQGQPVALASEPVGTVVVLWGDNGTGRSDSPPRVLSPRCRSRSTLAWHRDPMRFAGRSARAILVSAVAS
jgi:hypothetical protein